MPDVWDAATERFTTAPLRERKRVYHKPGPGGYCYTSVTQEELDAFGATGSVRFATAHVSEMGFWPLRDEVHPGAAPRDFTYTRFTGVDFAAPDAKDATVTTMWEVSPVTMSPVTKAEAERAASRPMPDLVKEREREMMRHYAEMVERVVGVRK